MKNEETRRASQLLWRVSKALNHPSQREKWEPVRIV